ncbi:GGDEF domain-containing protein [Xanthobacteraceae bacterium Astr-EGSB]|uniref:GGDEF domain-containing protein n=1 Tax=Astrobacterium formosum TaxID=3069710 RepID=UPI0027B79039|nr:GGDEF domain-containing protein [Xanthobacteraceae bacterium Astr-EGSB]
MPYTIHARILIACFIMMSMTAGIGALSAISQNSMLSDLDQTRRIASALRNYTKADRYHEGLQTSVYEAVAAGDLSVAQVEIERTFVEKAGRLYQAINHATTLDMPAEVHTAIRQVSGPLGAYMAAAERVIGLMFQDRTRALAELEDFAAAFMTMEQILHEAGDQIEAAANRIHDEAVLRGTMLNRAIMAALAVGLVVNAFLIAFMMTGVFAPLARIKLAMLSLTEGRSDVVIPEVSRRDEIGAMARSLQVFKDYKEQAEQAREMQREAELLLAEEGRLLTLAAHEAVVDPLTGLYNRRYLSRCLDDVVARAGRAGTPISFLMIDVDHFKDVNDSRGHFCGDDVLRKIARIMDRNRRAGDIAVRYGGDEFLMLAPNTDAQAARKFAERLRDAVATGDFKVDVDITVSIGTATLHGPADGVPEILSIADQALYAAKRAGRNCVCAAQPDTPDRETAAA